MRKTGTKGSPNTETRYSPCLIAHPGLYKIEAIPTIKRVSWELGSKIEKDTNKDFVACVNFTGKINAPAKGSITTQAFASAFFYTELETGYKNILLLEYSNVL